MTVPGEFADPAIRIADLVSAFGPNGQFVSICAPTFSPALQLVAASLGGLAPHCLAGSPGPQHDCTASIDGTPLPLCPAAAGTACLHLRASPLCPSGSDAIIDENGGGVDLRATVTLRCTGG
jgi:hypothetical protein